ncbi:unnamed protein product, partial [Ectocarpus sp. 12 AP-2014]
SATQGVLGRAGSRRSLRCCTRNTWKFARRVHRSSESSYSPPPPPPTARTAAARRRRRRRRVPDPVGLSWRASMPAAVVPRPCGRCPPSGSS